MPPNTSQRSALAHKHLERERIGRRGPWSELIQSAPEAPRCSLTRGGSAAESAARADRPAL
jgi:hypothetical protein